MTRALFRWLVPLVTIGIVSAPRPARADLSCPDLPQIGELVELRSSDPGGDERFGSAVALSGSTLVVGSIGEDDFSGAAYVFDHHGSSWSDPVRLTVDDEDTSWLGRSAAIHGNTLVLGGPGSSPYSETEGAVYVFIRDGDTWVQQAKLTASDAAPGRGFGRSVAIFGDTIVVGAYLDDHGAGEDAGSAYVFVRNAGRWTEQTKLEGAVAQAEFGVSVAMSGDTLVVGAHRGLRAGCGMCGIAHVFLRNGTGWMMEQTLLPDPDAPSPKGGPIGRFGTSVAVNIPPSEPCEDCCAANPEPEPGCFDQACADAVCNLDPFCCVAWWDGLCADLAAGTPPCECCQGPGDTILIGASGSYTWNVGTAHPFVRSGGVWVEQQRLEASDGKEMDFFGDSVALLDDVAIVGAYRHDQNPLLDLDEGAAYVFVRTGGEWSEDAKLRASDGGSDGLGGSVAVAGEFAVAGAAYDDHVGGIQAGAAYVFDVSNTPPVALCSDAHLAAGPTCSAEASIDAGSYDPGGGPITLEQFPPGPYQGLSSSVKLTVTDQDGASTCCRALVELIDVTPPEIDRITLDPDLLWPPNHHLVDVVPTVSASDNCWFMGINLISLSSSEADDAPGAGDGHTTDDMQIDYDTMQFKLRAERAGSGSGRIYTAVYEVRDISGNSSMGATHAVVPQDQGGVVDPVQIAVREGEGGTVVSWDPVDGAQGFDVVRGLLSNVAETGVVIDLGAVECIENDSVNETTSGREDAEIPPPGEAFFYLVEYFDGVSSSYGSESVGKPRAAGVGDCD